MSLKKGMYVRCPFDLEDQENPRVFVLGQITSIDRQTRQAKVRLYDLDHLRKFYEFPPQFWEFDLDQLAHCKIIEKSRVVLRPTEESGQIIYALDPGEDGYYQYYVYIKGQAGGQLRLAKEKEIIASFTQADFHPLEQMISYEFHNPFWYWRRNIVLHSLNALRNATYGFETLVGSRVLLLPHQVDTIIRALSEEKCRLMLADEVGLGKTIEACVIIKGLKERYERLRTLIVAPESLVSQWQNELSYKFWLEVPIYGRQPLNAGDIILPLEELATDGGHQLLSQEWDLCLVDETHRLLSMPEEYSLISELSRRIKHLLLLSATPIQQRRNEYLRLLALLYPQRYSQMDAADFDRLLEKQNFLRGRLQRLVRDLDYYLQDELAEDYVEELEEIAQELEDDTFTGLVQSIDIHSPDQGLDGVRLALAYLGEHYQMERLVIRHRRLELEERLPERQLDIIFYFMAGSDYNFHEADTYEALLTYLEKFFVKDPSPAAIEMAKLFLSAMFSSPWALQSIIEMRQRAIGEVREPASEGKRELPDSRLEKEYWAVLQAVGPLHAEEELLGRLKYLAGQWQEAVESEFERMDELYDDPDLIRGRLMKVIDYLSQSLDEEKFVIFSAFSETVIELERAIAKKFGPESVVSFHSRKEFGQLQQAVDAFQREPACRFLVCDELGGEGRNFQIANEVIHVDLPWSPVKIEQRIGRLDRVGRSNPVRSVVFCTQETIEEHLLNLWDKGLNIFRESLSGIEIAIGELQQLLHSSLAGDLRYGLKDVLDSFQEQARSMKEMVDEERYFDIARQLDPWVRDQLDMLISEFDKNEGEKLSTTMLAWATGVGLNPDSSKGGSVVTFLPPKMSPKSMYNAQFVPPDTTEARRRSRREQQISGTFSRALAVRREDLVFFAPGDPFFDAIVNNAYVLYRGRCAAFACPSGWERDWRGLIFTWVAQVDRRPLLEIGADPQHLVLAQGYIPLEPLTIVEPLTEEDGEIDEDLLLQAIEGPLWSNKRTHLGRRGRKSGVVRHLSDTHTSNLEWFKSQFPPGEWEDLVLKAYERSLEKVFEKVNQLIDWQKAERDFQRRVDGLRASMLYYGHEYSGGQGPGQLAKILQALLEGLKHPRLRLESVAFVWVVGKSARGS